jgi:hypothetical protein
LAANRCACDACIARISNHVSLRTCVPQRRSYITGGGRHRRRSGVEHRCCDRHAANTAATLLLETCSAGPQRRRGSLEGWRAIGRFLSARRTVTLPVPTPSDGARWTTTVLLVRSTDPERRCFSPPVGVVRERPPPGLVGLLLRSG